MSQIMKTFTGLFLVILLGTVSGGILAAQMHVLAAQNLQASIKYRLSCSNFAPDVMEECFADAEEAGDTLEIALHMQDGSLKFLTAASRLPDAAEQVMSARVNLRFQLVYPFPQLKRDYTLTGYVR